MARRKGASKSTDSDQGWRGRQRQQTEAHSRKIATANDMNEASMSSAAVPKPDSHADVECQKPIHKESSPPNIFNNSSSLKYLHKKFKRVASAVIEENCEKVRTSLLHALGETTSAAGAVQSSHINDSVLNSQEIAIVTAKCAQCRKSLDERQTKFCNECNPELMNAAAKYGHGVLRNELSKHDVGADLRTVGTRISAGIQLTAHKQYDTDSIDNLSKCKNDSSIRVITVSPLQQQKTNKHYEYDGLADDYRTKVNQMAIGTVPHNFKENLIKGAQFELAIQTAHVSTDLRNNNDASSSTANASGKSVVRRKTGERPYPCVTCCLEFKSRSQYYKHCRSASHGMKSANNNAQLPSEDVDLDISQSTSSDLELSSCSTTTSSDVISRSTTPLEDPQNVSSVPQSYLSSVRGQSGAHSIASLSAPDRPYKPKFHKAAYYQNNATNNNNTNSISQGNDSKAKSLVKSRHGDVISDNATISHQPPLPPPSVEYLKEHISKIISQNEAIMEGVEPALQKKYHKITGIPRGGSSNVNNLTDMQVPQISTVPPVKQTADDILLKVGAHESSSMETVKNSQRPFPTLQQQAQQALKKTHSTAAKNYTVLNLSSDVQPLNLTNSAREQHRKKSTGTESMHSGSPVASTSDASGQFFENHHPQNPERSIIKSLLLNSRGLAVPTTGEGDDAVYTCPLCNISFRSADNLQYHTKCYCQGTPQVSINQANGSPHSAPISPVGSPSHKYFRSNSFNLYRQEKYSPNTLAKLASSSLRLHKTPLSLAKLAAQQHYLNNSAQNAAKAYAAAAASTSRSAADNFKSSASNRSSSPSSAAMPTPTEAQSVSSQCVQITKQLMDASLPSPGPLLGKTQLVDHYNASRATNKSKESTSTGPSTSKSDGIATENALSLVDASKITPSKESTSSEETFAIRNQKLLQMCGGEITIVEKTEEKVPRFGSSGGSIVSISSSSPDSQSDNSPLSIRTGLLSGGSIIESPLQPKRKPSTTTNIPGSPANVPPLIPNLARNLIANYFQFPPPPINSITAYNPLTLPPKQPEFNSELPAAIEATSIIHGGKIIPFVPGIPGPNSLSANAPLSPIIPSMAPEKCSDRIFSPNQNANLFAGNIPLGAPPFHRTISLSITAPVVNTAQPMHPAKCPKSPETPPKVIKSLSSESSTDTVVHPHNLSGEPHQPWMSTTNREVSEKPFNFMRIADNLSPPKMRAENASSSKTHGNIEVSSTNLDRLKPRQKILIQVADVQPLHINIEPPANESQLSVRATHDMTPEKMKLPPNLNANAIPNPIPISIPNLNDADKNVTEHPAKFLRPTSLPLKPGTFTPKKHHGITPTPQTSVLISPETPRPSKHCVQLYLNGHAYTYLGLKCSTKPFYCTVNRSQPVYAVFAGRPVLSMYSNWQTCAENNPHPLGFSPKEVMSLYDSRQRNHSNHQGSKFTTSNKLTMICAASDKTRDAFKLYEPKDVTANQKPDDNLTTCADASDKPFLVKNLDESVAKVSGVENLSTVPGGYKSNEDYTYVRGRGRGRYVCIECGMRCIKPCTLKKHIRTVHSDVRPYTCRHCMFSFKTKGNLTKHMESKAHYKKCLEKGINPHTPLEDGVNSEDDPQAITANSHHSLTQANDDCDTVSDDSDADELEIDMESSDNEDAKLPDHEAAHCLLSLSRRSPCEESTVSPKSLVPSQPTTYPYVRSDLTATPKQQSTKTEFTANQSDGFIKSDSVISSPSGEITTVTSAVTSKMSAEIKSKRTSASSDAIDLSKPRSSSSSSSSSSESRESGNKANTSTTYAGAAELLKSLMTLSDKVPPISTPAYDLNLAPVSCNGQQSNHTNNMLLQTYLTERALQKSKMKLSQVHTLNAFDDKSGHKFFKESGSAFFSMLSKKLDHIQISPKPRSVITANLERIDPKVSDLKLKIGQNVPETILIDEQSMSDDAKVKEPQDKSENSDKDSVKIELHIAKPSTEAIDAKAMNDQSGMETLAEIAANSVKLDAPKCGESTIAQNRDALSSPHTAIKVPPHASETLSRKEISAKNIASEYLKLANEQDNAVDDSSASSDSDVTESGSKQVRRSSVMSLVPGQDKPLFSARTVVVGEDGFKTKSSNVKDMPMVALPRGSASTNATRPNVPYIPEDGGPVRCSLCPASFPKSHQLVLHMNIHYMNPERKFRCDSCGLNFQSQARLQKHMLSETHSSKVNIAETQGNSTSNPRPFECADCSRAFRIHGHLAKHLRSKTHVQRLENLQKIPFGTFQKIEEARINLSDIDTTDCDNSLASLKALAERLKVDAGSPGKQKTSTSDEFESNSSGSTNRMEQGQSTNDTNNIDINTGGVIKKRKLNDECVETLTISEGDEN